VLDGSSVPGMRVIERLASLRQNILPPHLLHRHDELIGLAYVRLVSEQLLTVIQRRRVLAEEADIRGHSEVRSTEPDQVPSMITHSLHLIAKYNQNKQSDR
jgi:hypothetical protein